MRIHSYPAWPIFPTKILIYGKMSHMIHLSSLWANLSSFKSFIRDSLWVYEWFFGRIDPIRFHLRQVWAILLMKILIYDQHEKYESFLSFFLEHLHLVCTDLLDHIFSFWIVQSALFYSENSMIYHIFLLYYHIYETDTGEGEFHDHLHAEMSPPKVSSEWRIILPEYITIF